jgi:hypothetical protein
MNKKSAIKREYCAPNVEKVCIDNEISLILESEPPVYGNNLNKMPESFNNDVFKGNIG